MPGNLSWSYRASTRIIVKPYVKSWNTLRKITKKIFPWKRLQIMYTWTRAICPIYLRKKHRKIYIPICWIFGWKKQKNYWQRQNRAFIRSDAWWAFQIRHILAKYSKNIQEWLLWNLENNRYIEVKNVDSYLDWRFFMSKRCKYITRKTKNKTKHREDFNENLGKCVK